MNLTFEIRVEEHLSQEWSEWLEGLAIRHVPDGATVLAGSLPDQAALFGVLIKIRDLGLTLVSLNQVESGEPPTYL